MYAACIEFPESVICASKSEDEFSCGLCAFPKDGFNGIMENVSKYKSIERCKDDSDFMINYFHTYINNFNIPIATFDILNHTFFTYFYCC